MKKIDLYAQEAGGGTTHYLYSSTSYKRCKDMVANYHGADRKHDKLNRTISRNNKIIRLNDCKIFARFDHSWRR